MSRKHDRAAELRAIADGRLMLNVRNGVTVPRSMLAMIADEIDALRAAPLTPAEVGGHADAQTEARALLETAGARFPDYEEYDAAVAVIASALAAKDAELAELNAVKSKCISATTRYQDAENEVHNLKAQLAEARKALEERDGLLDLALEVLDNYADPTGYTDVCGELLPSDADEHPGILAKETADGIRAARRALNAGGGDAN